MVFTSYTKTDYYYEFVGANGEKYIIPSTDVILVDDGTNALCIKLIGSRKTIGLAPKQ